MLPSPRNKKSENARRGEKEANVQNPNLVVVLTRKLKLKDHLEKVALFQRLVKKLNSDVALMDFPRPKAPNTKAVQNLTVIKLYLDAAKMVLQHPKEIIMKDALRNQPLWWTV